MDKQRVCEYCKAKLTGEERVCPNCGAPVKPAITPTPRAPQEPVTSSQSKGKSSAVVVIIIVVIFVLVFSLVGLCST
jgi:predicted amidophosphoribosyltransferase